MEGWKIGRVDLAFFVRIVDYCGLRGSYVGASCARDIGNRSYVGASCARDTHVLLHYLIYSPKLRIFRFFEKKSQRPFSFKNFHVMRLTASLGFEAKYRIASVILVYPANRKTASAVLRPAAKTWGMLPVLAFEASSPKTASRTQWDLFSIVQWCRCSFLVFVQ